LYSKADYIAVIDSDVVFFTFGIPGIIFDWSSHGSQPKARPKPVVHGHFTETSPFGNGIGALRLPRVAEFMQHPFIIERGDFPALRQFVVREVGVDMSKHEGPEQLRSDSGFAEAFLILQHRMHEVALQRRATWDEVPCFQTIMGHFLWHYRNDQYSWSIKYGNLSLWHSDSPFSSPEVFGQVPLASTCPALQVAIDLGGVAKTTGKTAEEVRQFRAIADEYAMAGLCFSQRFWKNRTCNTLVGIGRARIDVCVDDCTRAKSVKQLLFDQHAQSNVGIPYIYIYIYIHLGLGLKE